MAHPQQILSTLKAAARKSLSQNFLTSPHWADVLTRRVLETQGADEIWEIGPGLGALTQKLVESAKVPVRVFEFDKKLAEYLRATYPQIEVIEGDFLKADFAKLAQGKRIALLSNLPYHLSSAILFRLVENKVSLIRAVLTFQREFAQRLIALPRTKDFGALSVIAQLHFEMQSLGILPKGAFYPAPAVASEALMLEPKQESGVDSATAVVKAAFTHRRKKMSSNLKHAFPSAPIDASLEAMGLNPNVRPEELSKEQFLKLSSLLKKMILVLAFLPLSFASASQDQLFGLGGAQSGRVGSVTANVNNPYASLLNPAILGLQNKRQVQFSSTNATGSAPTFSRVLVDSPNFRTEHGDLREEDFKLPAYNSSLFALGLTFPIRLPVFGQAGIGTTITGPFQKLRSYHFSTPYDFATLHYGGADNQFKATSGFGLTLIPDRLSIGLGLSVYMTVAGSADATFLSDNPTGRMAMDVGLNTSPVLGVLAKLTDKQKLAITYRAEINPIFQQNIEGKLMVDGRELGREPFTLSTSLYYEPRMLEAEYEFIFGPTTYSLGLSYQMWSDFQPPFVKLSSPNPDGSSRETMVPAVLTTNTLTPRASVSHELIEETLIAGGGYRFRPSPIKDMSGPANLLDADTHVLGGYLEYRFKGFDIPIALSLFGQVHYAPGRDIQKTDSRFIGAPGYRFSYTSYAYGLSLGAQL